MYESNLIFNYYLNHTAFLYTENVLATDEFNSIKEDFQWKFSATITRYINVEKAEEDLNQFLKVDDKEEMLEPKKDSKRLLERKPFSEDFLKILGDNSKNTHGITAIDSRRVLDEILQDKVKHYMKAYCSILQQNLNLNEIFYNYKENYLKIQKFFSALEAVYGWHITFDKEYQPYFILEEQQRKVYSLYDLLKYVFGLNTTMVRKILCMILEYEQYGLTKFKHIDITDSYNSTNYSVPERISFTAGEFVRIYDFIKAKSRIIFSNSSGTPYFYGAYITYKEQHSNDSFCLQSSSCQHNDMLLLSKVIPSAHFLNDNLFSSDEEKTIFLFGDMRVAITLSNLYDKEEKIQNVVISGFLGEELSPLPWEHMKGNHVIYVPAPTISSLVLAKAIKKYLKEYAALSYRISNKFILHTVINKSDFGKLSNFEYKILNNAICPDEYGGYSQKVYELLDNIINEAKSTISYTQFYRKWRDAGYIQATEDDDKVCQSDVVSEEEEVSTPLQITCLDDLDFEENTDEYTLDSLLAPEYISLILGDSDSGKGFFAYTLSLAAAYGFSVFGFIVKEKRKVLYLDLETDRKDMIRKKKRITDSYSSATANSFFTTISGSDVAVDFDNEQFIQSLEATIKKEGIQMLVLDNVLTASEDGMNVSQQKVIKLYNILKRLAREFHVSTLTCHHTNKDGLGSGSSTLEKLAQNIFVLRGREVITQLKKKAELSEEEKIALQYAEERNGVLCSLSLKKCKRYSQLCGRGYWYLNNPADDGFIAKKWQKATATGWLEDAPLSEKMLEESIPKSVVVTESVSVGEFAEEDSTQKSAEIKVPLSDKDRRVLKIIYKIGNNGIKRSDIVSRYIEDTQDTEFNETKARGSIDKFRDRFLDNAYITDARLYRILEDKRAEVEEELAKLP